MKIVLGLFLAFGLFFEETKAFGESKFWTVQEMMRYHPIDHKFIKKERRKEKLIEKMEKHIKNGTLDQIADKLKPPQRKHHEKRAETNPIKRSNFVHSQEHPSSEPGGKIHMIKIYGDDRLQYYYMNLMVGQPFRQQSVIIDTGSDLTAIPCSRLESSRLHQIFLRST